MQLLQLVIWRFYSGISPVPTTQNTIPRSEPSRRFVFWKAFLAVPSHVRGNVSDVLMHSNVVVEELKIRHNLLQLCTTSNFDLPNCAFEGAKESLNPAILPRLVRRAALMFDAQFVHRQREIDRHKSAIIVGLKHFGFAEFVDQSSQRLNDFCSAFISQFKRQQFSATVVDHADQRMRLGFDTDICPIQCPGLIGFGRARRFPKLVTQLQNGEVFVFAKLRNKAFAD